MHLRRQDTPPVLVCRRDFQNQNKQTFSVEKKREKFKILADISLVLARNEDIDASNHIDNIFCLVSGGTH